MSSQRGNLQKKRPQKHQNRSAFKNNVHDTSKKTKQINSLVVTGVCQRCKDVVDWKIKYKKYKPLTQPRTCTRCHLKTVKHAYYTICIPCAQEIEVCQKCGEKKDVVTDPILSPAEQAARDTELQFELKRLSERQRRTFFRLQEAGKPTSEALSAASKNDTEQDSDLDSENDLPSNHGNQVSGDCPELSDSVDLSIEDASDHGDSGNEKVHIDDDENVEPYELMDS